MFVPGGKGAASAVAMAAAQEAGSTAAAQIDAELKFKVISCALKILEELKTIKSDKKCSKVYKRKSQSLQKSCEVQENERKNIVKSFENIENQR